MFRLGKLSANWHGGLGFLGAPVKGFRYSDAYPLRSTWRVFRLGDLIRNKRYTLGLRIYRYAADGSAQFLDIGVHRPWRG